MKVGREDKLCEVDAMAVYETHAPDCFIGATSMGPLFVFSTGSPPDSSGGSVVLEKATMADGAWPEGYMGSLSPDWWCQHLVGTTYKD